MEFNENKPIYLQLADQIMDVAERNPGLSGQRIPSVRDYAARYGVNANTVMRTYTWLQQEGIIYNQRGIGYFYSPDATQKILEIRRKVFFEKELPYFLGRLRTLEISPSDFEGIYRRYLENPENPEN